MAFPPSPAFPKAIDSDYELFLVYNTTETKICKENSAWAEEIEVIPVSSDKPEIWADNGFGNIFGELFYYDAVEKTVDADPTKRRVFKLRRCARNLGGTHTKTNPKGTWVRSYVVAEHHNQVVDATLNIENFVGKNYDERPRTLDWRIRHLEALATIYDDYTCPDVTFTFNIIENDDINGSLAYYLIELKQPNAGYINSNSTFRLDFGDGDYTTTQFTGYHRYAVNALIDPIVTIANDQCQIIQSPVERINATEPQLDLPTPLDIPIPSPPNVEFTYVPCEVPEMDIVSPPIVFPCISIEGQVGPIPSVIVGPYINMFSHVLIEATHDTLILYSYVEVHSDHEFVMVSYAELFIQGSITMPAPIPPTIVIVTDSNLTLSLDATDMPKLEVDWGSPPAMEIALTMPMQPRTTLRDSSDNEFGAEFADIFQAEQHVKVEYEPVGIPSEIKIIPPTMPKVEFDTSNLPRSIKVDTSEVKIPETVTIMMEHPIPDQIMISGAEKIPSIIEVVNRSVPTSIELVSRTNIPEKIEVELSSPIPERIIVETLTPIPERIILEAVGIPTELQVVGIPDQIEVVGFPESIPLVLPEKAEIELVWKGGPLELKLDMQEMITKGDDGKTPCFMLTPCGK